MRKVDRTDLLRRARNGGRLLEHHADFAGYRRLFVQCTQFAQRQQVVAVPRMVEVLQQPGHILLAAGPEQALHALLYATGLKAIVVMLLIVQVIDCIDHRHRKPAVAGHFGHMTVKHVKCVHDNDRIVRAGLQRLQESRICQRV